MRRQTIGEYEMAYRIERLIPGDFRDYLMNLWEGDDLPSFIGSTSKAYHFGDKGVADAVAQRLAAKFPQTMETPHLKSQPITYEVVKVRYKHMITPEQCGASQLACNIVNETFLSLDGFAAMRKQMAGTTYTAEQFGAELARIVDRNIHVIQVSHLIEVIQAMVADTEEKLIALGWESIEQYHQRSSKDEPHMRAVELLKRLNYYDRSKPAPHRTHTCLNCKHQWSSPVVLSEHSPAISGERTEQCPSCNSRGISSSPIHAPKDWESIEA